MNGTRSDRAPADRPVSLSKLLSRAFTLASVLGVSSALIAVTGTGILLQRRFAHDNLQLLAQQAAYVAEIPIVFGDMTALQTSLDRALPAENIASYQVRDSNNATLLNVSRGAERAITPFIPDILLPEPAEVPVISSGSRIGTVRLTSSGQGIGRLLLASLLGTILCLGAISAGTRLIARRLNDMLVTPLQEMTDVAHAVRQDTKFDRRVPNAGVIEVNALSDDFNALLDTLEQWQGQMANTHRDLLHKASYDPLSGLLNRSAFIDRISDAIRSASRNRDRFALLFMDGDNFKRTNDDFGHAAGDTVIAEVARRIPSVLRVGDIAARVGGDEFAVLIHHLEQDDDAHSVAARIAQAMNNPITLPGGQAVVVGISIGIATYPDDGADAETLIEAADSRMYADKHARKAGAEAAGKHDNENHLDVSR